jgi:hypothetical protein
MARGSAHIGKDSYTTRIEVGGHRWSAMSRPATAARARPGAV